MSETKYTFSDDRGEKLEHYGVKGMRWRHHKAKISNNQADWLAGYALGKLYENTLKPVVDAGKYELGKLWTRYSYYSGLSRKASGSSSKAKSKASKTAVKRAFK